MTLREFFSIDEIDKMDVRQRTSFIERINEKKKQEKYELQLLIAECINMAYIGSQPAPRKGGANPNFKVYQD